MKVQIVKFLLGVLLVVGSTVRLAAADDVDEKDVVVLGDKNFTEGVKKNKFALVEFYAPWCGHCKNLKPEYAQAATTLKKEMGDVDVVLAKVDATVEKAVSEEHGIRGFPTLKWFVDGELASDYSGGRTAGDIVAWIKKKTGPAAVPVESEEALDKAKKDEVAVFAYVAKEEGSEYDAFMKVATKTEDVNFYLVKDESIAKKLGIAKAPGFAVSRNFAGFEPVIAVSEDDDSFKPDGDGISAFIKAEKLPPYFVFSKESSSRIFGSGIDHQVIIGAQEADLKAGSALLKAITGAKGNKGKVVTVVTDMKSADGAPVIDYFGFDKESKTPQVAGFNAKAGKKYGFPEGKDVTSESLVAFAKTVLDGSAAPMTKSAPVPEEPFEDNVRVVVGKNFDEIVKDPKKAVLLEVYAPWCGHCKKLAPTYAELGAFYKDSDKVVIAKMDGTTNEVADLDVKGFPTILFFDAKEGAKGEPYEGGRDLDSFKKFLENKTGAAGTTAKDKKEEKKGEHEEL